jgi:hypothetical protein
MSKRFTVYLEGAGGISSLAPSAWLDHEPDEDEEIELEDGTRAVVKYTSEGEEGQTVIAARRL